DDGLPLSRRQIPLQLSDQRLLLGRRQRVEAFDLLLNRDRHLSGDLEPDQNAHANDEAAYRAAKQIPGAHASDCRSLIALVMHGSLEKQAHDIGEVAGEQESPGVATAPAGSSQLFEVSERSCDGARTITLRPDAFDEPRSEALSELHSPLVERIHVPYHALHEHLVLVQRHEPPERSRVELSKENQRASPVPGVSRVRAAALPEGVALRKRPCLRETVRRREILLLLRADGRLRGQQEVD